jgi:hypothetical protein
MPLHAPVNLAIDLYMSVQQLRLRAPMLRATQSVRAAQQAVLGDILKRNAQTVFGKTHGFAEIATPEEYRARVSVQSYDSLSDLVLRQQEGEATLTAEKPVYYARTSGTTSRSKFIPLTKDGLAQIRAGQQLLALSLWKDTRFFEGSILGFASPFIEGRLENGVGYGSTSGSTYRSLSAVIAGKFLVPDAAFAIKDLEAKYLLYALAVLSAGNITGVVAANPSSILKVTDLVNSKASALLDALRTGSPNGLPAETRAAGEKIMRRADRRRVNRLANALKRRGGLSPQEIWPRLSAIATWTGGSCSLALDRLKTQLPGEVRVVEFGYGASEFIGAANVDARSNACLPLLTHHYYEFVPRAAWEAGQARFLGLYELNEGEDYYIFITTRSGLYRYDINDIVRAGSKIGECPSLRFVQKGRGVTSITGEKLSEHQVMGAFGSAAAELGIVPVYYLALADERDALYRLYIECDSVFDTKRLTRLIEAALRQANSEYDDKRASGRLAAPMLFRLKAGAAESFKRESVGRGVHEAQYKPVLLDYARNWGGRIEPMIMPGAKAE